MRCDIWQVIALSHPEMEEIIMRIAKETIPVRIDVPGATARQQRDFGDVTGYGQMGAEYFSFGAGTDITELLHGLENNSCQSGSISFLRGYSIRADMKG